MFKYLKRSIKKKYYVRAFFERASTSVDTHSVIVSAMIVFPSRPVLHFATSATKLATTRHPGNIPRRLMLKNSFPHRD